MIYWGNICQEEKCNLYVLPLFQQFESLVNSYRFQTVCVEIHLPLRLRALLIRIGQDRGNNCPYRKNKSRSNDMRFGAEVKLR